MSAAFPARRPGRRYLTEGGIETEIMYRWGHELPHFAMYPLLEDPRAMVDVRGMYRAFLDVAAARGFSVLMGGLDYRASPDWGRLVGYSPAGLAEANLRSIAFLRELAAEYADDIDEILVQGFVGPRGDAYERDVSMTREEAEDYHAVQLATLAEADVDLAWAFTFSDEEEAIGVARDKLRSVFTLDTVNDRKFLITTGMSIVAIVAATELEFFHRLLDTVSLTGEQWWICIGAGAVIVLVSEIWKFVLRRRV